jgi:hypothetical protein
MAGVAVSKNADGPDHRGQVVFQNAERISQKSSRFSAPVNCSASTHHTIQREYEPDDIHTALFAKRSLASPKLRVTPEMIALAAVPENNTRKDHGLELFSNSNSYHQKVHSKNLMVLGPETEFEFDGPTKSSQWCSTMSITAAMISDSREHEAWDQYKQSRPSMFRKKQTATLMKVD